MSFVRGWSGCPFDLEDSEAFVRSYRSLYRAASAMVGRRYRRASDGRKHAIEHPVHHLWRRPDATGRVRPDPSPQAEATEKRAAGKPLTTTASARRDRQAKGSRSLV